jgi:hypothetical protein
MSSMQNATTSPKPLYGARRALAAEEARQRRLADQKAAEEEYNKIDKSKITQFVESNPDDPIAKTFAMKAREAAQRKLELERAKMAWKRSLEDLMTAESYIMLVTEASV